MELNMLLKPLISPFISRLVILLLAAFAPSAAAPQPSQELHPILRQLWLFEDIHVTVIGPNIVKIEWKPLARPNQYVVQRDGAPIGPVFYSDPTATATLSYTDNVAPANSTVTYMV